jgi:phospholipid transport system substrate-binding protein
MWRSKLAATFREGSIVFVCLFALFFTTEAVPGSIPGPPLAVIRSGTDRAVDILKNRAKDGRSLRERKEEILVIVDDYFDFHEMAKRALGKPWKDQTPENQKEFVRLFKQMLFNAYVDKVDTYAYSKEQVKYETEQLDGKYALVKTNIYGYRDKAVNVDYRMLNQEGSWKVYDVYVEGISLVNNYRQQFNSILSNESFESLLKRMREKVASQSET